MKYIMIINHFNKSSLIFSDEDEDDMKYIMIINNFNKSLIFSDEDDGEDFPPINCSTPKPSTSGIYASWDLEAQPYMLDM